MHLIILTERKRHRLYFYPMLFLHLYEALCRMGDQESCDCFRTLSLPDWLREVGLIELRQKPTLIVRSQPLSPVERKFVDAMLAYYAGQAEQAALPSEELDLWRELADLDAGDHITHHPGGDSGETVSILSYQAFFKFLLILPELWADSASKACFSI